MCNPFLTLRLIVRLHYARQPAKTKLLPRKSSSVKLVWFVYAIKSRDKNRRCDIGLKPSGWYTATTTNPNHNTNPNPQTLISFALTMHHLQPEINIQQTARHVYSVISYALNADSGR